MKKVQGSLLEKEAEFETEAFEGCMDLAGLERLWEHCHYILMKIIYFKNFFAIMCILKIIFPVLGAAKMTNKNLQVFFFLMKSR